jgi:hypothetical protein
MKNFTHTHYTCNAHRTEKPLTAVIITDGKKERRRRRRKLKKPLEQDEHFKESF